MNWYMVSLAAIAVGFVIDVIVGDPHAIPHPVVWIGKWITVCERLLRSWFPKSDKGELAAGVILVVLVLIPSTGIPLLILWWSSHISWWLYFVLESMMCWQLLAARSLEQESKKVYMALAAGDVEGARTAVSMIVGRDTAVLDDIGITKAAVETVAENTSDGVIAPLFYMALGGAVLGFFYKAVNTMDSMVGYTSETYYYFGRAAARLDDVVNYIPARLSALLMILASGLQRTDMSNAMHIWQRDRRKHASPNSAQTEAVMAGALQIQLAGDAWYGGVLHKKDFIGDALRHVEYADILRADRLMYTTAIEMLVLVLLLSNILWI